jgi:hypothetical protein
MFASILGRDTHYPDFPQFLYENATVNTFMYAMIASFHILSNSSFVIIAIQSY